METPHDAVLLRIFTDVADKCGTEPLYQAIVKKAREMNLAGATVLRAPLGFGQSATLHEAHLIPLRDNTPVVIEIVDVEAKIDSFLPVLDAMMEGGLITLEAAKVLQYGKHKAGLIERLKRHLSLHGHRPPGASAA